MHGMGSGMDDCEVENSENWPLVAGSRHKAMVQRRLKAGSQCPPRPITGRVNG